MDLKESGENRGPEERHPPGFSLGMPMKGPPNAYFFWFELFFPLILAFFPHIIAHKVFNFPPQEAVYG